MLYTIKNDFLTVAVAGQGAELMSIQGSDGTEYLWQGDPKYWSDRALNIFPYVARLTDGSYYMDGELHQMNIHGIAPYCCFAVAEHTEEKLVLELVSDDENYTSYPRTFAFRICYALRENTLEVTFEVENKDGKTMYFGLGGHPGFNVPLDGGSFEDYCNAIKKCAGRANCRVLDIYDPDTPYDTIDGFHPTAEGMQTIADAVIAAYFGGGTDDN